ncbi:HNH endonuclease, partial [Kineococcus sp. R8]|uniref:HNH endonuclease n=1 Tax=Kineococcus siccus TaxID=2696567 RepID=UPI0014127330
RVAAIDCDLDHVIAWPEGASTADNLQPLCRSHHRFKTQYVYETATANRRRNAGNRRALLPPPSPVDDSPPPF